MLHTSYLNAGLGQIDLHRQILAREHVRIVRLREGRLQLFELLQRERGAVAALLAPHERLIVDGRMVGVAGVCMKVCMLDERSARD